MNQEMSEWRSWRRRLLDKAPKRLQSAAWAMLTYRRKFGHWPNLLAPRTFNEKAQLHKIFNHDRRLPVLADKVLVKDFVRAKLGPGWVIPTLWSGTTLPPIADRTWPKPFVVKVNSGCGWNIFVRSEAGCDWPDIEARCSAWMASTFGHELGEWHYAEITPQILIEPFIAFDEQMPPDFKFWVFNGKVEYIQVVTDREFARKVTFYDPAWNRLPYHKGIEVDPRPMPAPVSLQQMIEGAEKLGADLSFVRVDFYEVGGKPLFGEMTFYPDAGFANLNPPEFDARLAQLWR
jgi:hypothetical protein